MNNLELANQIKRVIRNQLDDCDRALSSGNITRAKSELDDAVTKLKRLARHLTMS